MYKVNFFFFFYPTLGEHRPDAGVRAIYAQIGCTVDEIVAMFPRLRRGKAARRDRDRERASFTVPLEKKKKKKATEILAECLRASVLVRRRGEAIRSLNCSSLAMSIRCPVNALFADARRQSLLLLVLSRRKRK